MTSPGDRLWNAVRESVRREIEQSSLRAVARDIEMEANTLHYFLAGARPQARNARKLRELHARVLAARGELDVDAVLPLVPRLVPGGLPLEAHTTVLEAIAPAVAEVCQEHGITPPLWVRTLTSGPQDAEE